MNRKKTPRHSLIHKYFGLLQRRGHSDRLLLHISLFAFIAISIFALFSLSENRTVATPSSGGTLTEGIVGTPRFVNPVLATTRADKDLVSLMYSGLMKIGDNKELVPDLAESIELSEDGQTYSIVLRDDAYFHDGTKVTAKDVAYTISLIQNPDLKSPLRGNWDGVLVQERGERELDIVITEPYSPFIENFTVGIVPRHIWDELPTEQLPFSQNNTNPVGSGPYQIDEITYNKSGLINKYKLKAADNYQDTPNIQFLELYFYSDEAELLTALEKKEIMATAGLSPEKLKGLDKNKFTVLERPLPRTFSIYFNQNKSPALREKAVREALSIVIDREALINDVLSGYGIATESPIPTGFIDATNTATTTDFDPITKAKGILSEAGWSQDEDGHWSKGSDEKEIKLTVALSTANTPLFDKTATHIAKTWETLGVEVQVAQYEQTDLVQSIIRPRDFQALLFGADIGRTIDLYPFWHSSQKSDPGLNIAQYTNIDTDALLEDARTTTDKTEHTILNNKVTEIIKNDIPAVFLFTPTFGYVYDKELSLDVFSRISSQSERFADITKWYVTEEKLWPIFSN